MDRLMSEARVEGMDKNEKTEYYKNMRNAFDIKSEKWFAREDGIKIGLTVSNTDKVHYWPPLSGSTG